MSVTATCPTGYFPVPGDSSNCTNSNSTTVVKRVCPSGLFLQDNGLCGTNAATILQTSAAFCGPQYATKNCVYTAQLTPGITPTTDTESVNTICAFIEEGAQFPCDPGCCLGQKKPGSESENGNGTTTGIGIENFPWWVILLLILLGTMFMIFVLYLATRKKKLTSNSYGRRNTFS